MAIHIFSFFSYILFVNFLHAVYVWHGDHACCDTHVEVPGQLVESGLSSHHVCPRGQTQVGRVHNCGVTLRKAEERKREYKEQDI